MIFNKRRKFLLVSLILSWGLLVVQQVGWEYRYIAILILAGASYLLSAWSLKEDLDGIEWFANLVLPTLFLPSLSLFYFLFPSRLIFQLVIFLLATIGQYGILLSANIFSVAVIRTIQLLRAAQAMALLFTLIITFFLFDSLFSFRLNPLYNSMTTFIICIPLIFQGLWVNKLDKSQVRMLWVMAFHISFIEGQLAFMISHWPVNILIASLWLVSIVYVVLSLLHYDFSKRLFGKTVAEYIRLGVLMFIILLTAAKWG